MKSVCIFCGSSEGSRPDYRRAAEQMADALVTAGLELVYGGARVGLMGRLADAVLAHGGKVTGVIPGALFPKEVPHAELTRLHVVDSMHERKQRMYELSDGFIALPGGLGTLDELFEILTWGQLGLHGKPCGLLNVSGYFDKVLEFLDLATGEGFLKLEHRRLLLDDARPGELLRKLREFRPPGGEKWLDPRQT